MALCSIVIPWYRDLAELRRAVDSVFAQDEQDFEVIVVANGVSDSAYQEMVGLYADPRFRTARLGAPGGAAARNHGAALARGRLIFFLDADDRFHPTKLSRFVAFYRDSGFEVAFSRGCRVRGGGVSWIFPVGYWDGSRPVAEYFFCDGCTISSSAIVISARAKGRATFTVPSKQYEDPDFIIRAEYSGLDVKMLPEALYDWFDERSDNRVSRRVRWDERLAWIAELPDNVTPRARAAFRARCIAQHVFPRKPIRCLAFFIDAFMARAVPARDVALFLVRGLIPKKLRERLLNYYFLRRSRCEGEKEAGLAKSRTTG